MKIYIDQSGKVATLIYLLIKTDLTKLQTIIIDREYEGIDTFRKDIKADIKVSSKDLLEWIL